MREDPVRTTRIRERDQQALEQVVREQLPVLLRGARAAGLSLDEAEDAVQATFLTFVRRCQDFDGRARVGTWLYGILIRKVAETRRAHGREDATDDIDAIVDRRFDAAGRWIAPPRGPDAELNGAEAMRHLAECVEQLAGRQRLAFALRVMDDRSTEEVCKALDVSRNNLGVLLFRARNRLRECLEGKGIEGSHDAVV